MPPPSRTRPARPRTPSAAAPAAPEVRPTAWPPLTARPATNPPSADGHPGPPATHPRGAGCQPGYPAPAPPNQRSTDMTITQDLKNMKGRTAVDADGANLGKIGEVYLDDRTSQPLWVTISTGTFGTKESFAPLYGSRAHGDDLQLA